MVWLPELSMESRSARCDTERDTMEKRLNTISKKSRHGDELHKKDIAVM